MSTLDELIQRGIGSAPQGLLARALVAANNVGHSRITNTGPMPLKDVLEIYERRQRHVRDLGGRFENFESAVVELSRSQVALITVYVVDNNDESFVFFVDDAAARVVSAFCIHASVIDP